MNTEQPAALAPGIAPPQQIHLGDLLLRSWQPEDLVPRFDAVTASFDHLHPWMDWLAEPMTLGQHRAFGDAMATSWPSPDGSCNYGIFDVDGALFGAIGIHDRVGPRTLEIGYWCHVAHTGRGIITRSAAAVPRRLGYRLDRVAPREVRAPAESGRGMFWIKDNFPASRPAARSEHG
ncbi:GNAT family N-acetyltransferase [Nocardia vinacea]|uniref:GNAT family N-acetyltransferase n=1 Tax=Nocardia vinacea TaxID=96468 RepID=UPI002E13A391|nr:GNAT family N-acetyltransferase [Nocardia vinacea]